MATDDKDPIVDYAPPPRGDGGGCGEVFLEAIGGFTLGWAAWAIGAASHTLPVAVIVWVTAASLIGFSLYKQRPGYIIGFLIMLGIAGLAASICGPHAFY